MQGPWFGDSVRPIGVVGWTAQVSSCANLRTHRIARPRRPRRAPRPAGDALLDGRSASGPLVHPRWPGRVLAKRANHGRFDRNIRTGTSCEHEHGLQATQLPRGSRDVNAEKVRGDGNRPTVLRRYTRTAGQSDGNLLGAKDPRGQIRRSSNQTMSSPSARP